MCKRFTRLNVVVTCISTAILYGNKPQTCFGSVAHGAVAVRFINSQAMKPTDSVPDTSLTLSHTAGHRGLLPFTTHHGCISGKASSSCPQWHLTSFRPLSSGPFRNLLCPSPPLALTLLQTLCFLLLGFFYWALFWALAHWDN